MTTHALQRQSIEPKRNEGEVYTLPNVELRLTSEYALRAAIDTQVFSSLRDLESLDGGRAVQSVYIALIRRIPNVVPDRKRIAIDCGFSESSVRRAIVLLERAGLVTVKRSLGFSSKYQITDLRYPEAVSECLNAIRKMARTIARGETRGRVTSEPTNKETRVRSEPTPRLTSEPGVGSQVNHEDTSKNQIKQQAVVAGEKRLGDVLKKWGLSSATYLVNPRHEKSIEPLSGDPKFAAEVLDRAMRKASWTTQAGVGARVEYLRESANEIARQVTAEKEKTETQNRITHVKEDPLRHELEKKIDEMTPIDFQKTCEQMFLRHKSLRSLTFDLSKKSTGLRLRVLEFLYQEHQERAGG